MLVEQYNALNRENASPKLDRYFQTKTLKRLEGRGMFCGMDYVGIKELVPIEKYTRLDHSKNVAYTASILSDDLKAPLAGAFHDVGTISFAHVNSFKKGKALTQDSDELNVESLIKQDEELLTYLREDNIALADVVTAEKYPLIDKEIPCLCLDRADGILSTCLIWAHTHNFEEIKNLYYMLSYCDNLAGQVVDVFSERFQNFTGEVFLTEDYTDFEEFFKAINNYSKKLLSKESRYMMEVLGLTLNYYEDLGVITEADLFNLSEEEIINKIMSSKYSAVWRDVTTFDKVSYAKNLEDGLVIISKPKIRQANPLCFAHMNLCEIHEISGDFYRELNDLAEDIILTDKALTSNLSQSTVKILSKYQRK